MIERTEQLSGFLHSLEAAIQSQGNAEALQTSARIFSKLKSPGKSSTQPHLHTQLPACKYLQEALDTATVADNGVAETVQYLSLLIDQVTWIHREGVEPSDEPFFSAHANAIISGPGGIEERDDVWIGCSLVAPNTRYPDHKHPPAEVYLVLSDGEWRQENDDWFEPGVGGVVYNSPDIVHAMRSHEKPLLAVWCLLVENT